MAPWSLRIKFLARPPRVQVIVPGLRLHPCPRTELTLDRAPCHRAPHAHTHLQPGTLPAPPEEPGLIWGPQVSVPPANSPRPMEVWFLLAPLCPHLMASPMMAGTAVWFTDVPSARRTGPRWAQVVMD